MQINPEIIEELILDAGEARAKKARNYKQAKKVIITETKYEDQNNFEIKAEVYGTETYNTYIEVKKGEIEDITCTCQDYQQHYGVCKHSLATILELRDKNETAKKEQQKKIIDKNEAKYRSFRQIVNTFYNEEIDDIAEDEETTIKNKGTIKIEPKIYFDRFTGEMKAEFKIGEKRLYKIKELSEFYDRIMNKTYYKYGDKLQFIHTKEAFTEESQKLLEFILKYAEIIKYANASSNSTYHYYGKALSDTSIMLSNTGIDDLFEIIKGKEIRFQRDGIEENVEFIDKDPNLKFKLNKEKDEYVIQPNQDIFKMNIIRGKTHKYILKESEFYRLSSEFEKTKLKLVNSFRQNYVSELHLAKDDLMQLFSVIMPKIKNAIKLGNVSEEEIEEYKPKELGVKVFLDYDKNNCSIQNVFGDSLEMNAQILSEVGRGYREEIKFEISRCEELAKKIGNLAWNIYLASGGNKNSKPKDIGSILDAKSQLYYRLDIPFRSWLSSLDPENDDKLEKFEQWQNTAKRITLDLGRELVAAVDDTAMVGHMIDETIYSAPKAYNIFLRDVSKIYQKI